MPIDARIPLMTRNPQFMTPQQMVSLKDLSNRAKLSQMQLQYLPEQQRQQTAAFDLGQENVRSQMDWRRTQADAARAEAVGKLSAEANSAFMNAYMLNRNKGEEAATQAGRNAARGVMQQQWSDGRARNLGITDEQYRKGLLGVDQSDFDSVAAKTMSLEDIQGLQPEYEQATGLPGLRFDPRTGEVTFAGTPEQQTGITDYARQMAEARAPRMTQITGQPLRKGQEEFDKVAAPIFVDWAIKGGYAAVETDIRSLDSAIDKLNTSDMISGVFIGLAPDRLKAAFAPQAIQTRDQILSVVQKSIKQVLDAQFGQKEAELILGRAYNENLDEAQNVERLQRLLGSLLKAAEAKQKAYEYFNEHGGTLLGYEGPGIDFSLRDVTDAIEGRGPLVPDEKPKPQPKRSSRRLTPEQQAEVDALEEEMRLLSEQREGQMRLQDLATDEQKNIDRLKKLQDQNYIEETEVPIVR